MDMDFDVQDMEGYWDLVGSEAPDGWKKLYKPIVEYIRCHNEKYSKEERIRILQIKEWAGQLSIFVDGGGEELQEMIFQAEQRSKTTCQVCGAEGKEYIKGNHYFIACKRCLLL